MSPAVKKTSVTVLRWLIAVAGIWFVLAKTSFHDRVIVLDPANNRPVAVNVLGNANDSDSRFLIQTRSAEGRWVNTWIDRDQVWIKPDGSTYQMRGADGELRKAKLLAVRPGPRQDVPAELVIQQQGGVARINPAKVGGVYSSTVPYPIVDTGLIRLVRGANPHFLIAALAILPVSYLITSYRWHMLLELLEIHIALTTTFVLNMVGAFYNTFMPGSTGGDLIRAYYASKHTTHRVRSVISVIVDRAIGLLALIILGGAMATAQLSIPECRRVALGCAVMLGSTAMGLFVFYHPLLRRITGLEFILSKLPLQRQVSHAVEAMHLYGRRPVGSLVAIAISFPVHITGIVSAYFAGRAFGVPLHFSYYWVVVPVIVLVGAIPISPQGAGVMEFFAIELTRHEGVPTSQAIALAMSIRLGQMFWNLMAGMFVLRGGYHAPNAAEKRGMEDDSDAPPETAGGAKDAA